MAYEWYFLDEDCRPKTPGVLHCIRCKRKVKDTMAITGFKKVVRHFDEPWVRIANLIEDGELIGADCWQQITANGTI